ncbi:Hypothetical protein CINCED_3A004739 [Cinara cedri]|uniref:Uncharacterized protein n=1 Tax=Cinara cedri TaxID=506608 RepID=A0A5E4MH58_9HEMI|nr:Hypothetical protein CINCED_3A004739 [Cinara cedri]
MTTKSNGATTGSCCREDTQMVRCAMIALEKMRDMFKTALCSPDDYSPTRPTAASGCALNTNCAIKGCPFRGTGVPNVLDKICIKSRPPAIKTKQNKLKLRSGEVGMNDNRVTFHLGQSLNQPESTNDNYPTSPTYFNVQPMHPPVSAMALSRGVDLPKQRKNMMKVQSSLPQPTDQVVGMVTGLPIAKTEDVFFIEVAKQYNNERKVLQMEVRLPKQVGPVMVDAFTQYEESDFESNVVVGNGEKGGKGGKGKKGKK